MYAYGLAKLIEKHDTKIQEIADVLGVTRQGYYHKMTVGTFNEKDLQKLADYFNVPVTYFEFEEASSVENPTGHSKNKSKSLDKVKYENQILREIIDKKDKEIERLNREIGRLESKAVNKE
ncbi:MAG: helix-turn-helix transcriptional regulator [Bacteroidales bacterium]|jgi:transcriptional regulator with XRE-family HTH domain|nr:helix-turn-helix transcriptional regulator [Bacteroidales bacterium]